MGAPSERHDPDADSAAATGRAAASQHVLAINGGSSSLKFAVFDVADPLARRLLGKVERIGSDQATLSLSGGGADRLEHAPVDAPDQKSAARLVIDRLGGHVDLSRVAAVGHRVVHGGGRYTEPCRITPALLDELRAICPFDPDHIPGEIELIEAFAGIDPPPPQVACFDTAFHHDMPRVARLLPIPRRYEADGIRRYGFHGLSYAYLLKQLASLGGPQESRGRVILAHLGAGASMAAVLEGRSLDTTMGFTPTAGLVMASRTGDLDPGLVSFLMRTKGLTADEFSAMVNHDSGLVGVSETSGDVRDLLAREAADVRAAEALELFCYSARRWIGALAAALGGLDTLVFSGGIGENSPSIRARICEKLAFLGIRLDRQRNEAGAVLMSEDEAAVRVRVIPTDEERMIAESTCVLLSL